MRFSLFHGGGLLNNLTGGMLGTQKSPQSYNTPTPADNKAQDQEAADEAARKLRARERMRSGVAATNTSGVSTGEFQATGTQKKSLLG